MKTDEEMIRSLFKRRDEYYREMQNAKLRKHCTGRMVLKFLGGILIPIATVSAATFAFMTIQNNHRTDIDLTGNVTETKEEEKKIGFTAADGSTMEELNNMYVNDKASLGEDFLEVGTENTVKSTMCISYNGKIYFDPYYYNPTTSASVYEGDLTELRFEKAGLGSVMEPDFAVDGENARCTVFDVVGERKYKAVFTCGCLRIYEEVGEDTYVLNYNADGGDEAVQPIEFKIKATHTKAGRYITGELPVFRDEIDVTQVFDDNSIVYYAYDTQTAKISEDVFMLFTNALNPIGYSDLYNVLWETEAQIPPELKSEAPSEINLITYDDVKEIIESVYKGDFTLQRAREMGTVAVQYDRFNGSPRYKLFFVDGLGGENTLAITVDKSSDKITNSYLQHIVSGYFTDLKYGETDLDKYIEEANMWVQTKPDEEVPTINRNGLVEMVQMMNRGELDISTLKSQSRIDAADSSPNTFNYFFAGETEDFVVLVTVGEDGFAKRILLNGITSGTETEITSVNGLYEVIGEETPDDRVYIDSRQLWRLASLAKENALTTKNIENMGGVKTDSEKAPYCYELYYSEYSSLVYRITVTADFAGNVNYAVMHSLASGKSVDLRDSEAEYTMDDMLYDDELEFTSPYLLGIDSQSAFSEEKLRKIAQKAADGTLTLQYLEDMGASYASEDMINYTSSKDMYFAYTDDKTFYNIYVYTDMTGNITDVIMENCIHTLPRVSYQGVRKDDKINLVTEYDKLDEFLARYEVSLEQLKEIAELSRNHRITAEYFEKIGVDIYTSEELSEMNKRFSGDYDYTVYDLYYKDYMLEGVANASGKITNVLLTRKLDSVNMSIDLMTDSEQLMSFLGEEKAEPEIIASISSKQFGEIENLASKCDVDRSASELDECGHTLLEDYILYNIDYIITGVYYNNVKMFYTADGTEYELIYSVDPVTLMCRLELTGGGKTVDLMS